MRTALASLLAAHGATHLIGFVKAFEIASLPAVQPISRPMGLVWLAAATLFIAAALAVQRAPRAWWIPASMACLLSQYAILASWSDAWFGTIVDMIVLGAIGAALWSLRSSRYASIYHREVAARQTRHAGQSLPVTEADLSGLPPPVALYLRRAGVVGRPRAREMTASFRGRMRNGRDAPWMDATTEQHSFFDPPSRIFLMRAAMRGIPFEALHVFARSKATMQVRVASLLDLVDARGPEMDRSETVTHFNDMCVLAPSTLLDPSVRFEPIDQRRVRAIYDGGAHTITAELIFDRAGDLAGFVSSDRSQTTDGVHYRHVPWSTPVSDHRDYGGVRLPSRARASWLEPEGELTYGEFEIVDVRYDPSVPARSGPAPEIRRGSEAELAPAAPVDTCGT
jgi:hypothetical protein